MCIEFQNIRSFKENFIKLINENNQKKWSLYQDQDPKHRSKLCQNFYRSKNINWINDWPAVSPDLNPIENIWSWIKSKIQDDYPKNKKQLEKSIKKWWKSISPQMCKKFIRSWKNRCDQIIFKKGEKINY